MSRNEEGKKGEEAAREIRQKIRSKRKRVTKTMYRLQKELGCY